MIGNDLQRRVGTIRLAVLHLQDLCGAIDDRAEPTVAQCRQQVGGEVLGRLGALRRVAQPVADAVEVQAPLGEPIDIERARCDTAHPADRDKPSADSECIETGYENVAADIVDDHVDTLVADNP